MKFKKITSFFVLISVTLLCSCSLPSPDGMPEDKINLISDGTFIEPEFVKHKVSRLLYERLSQNEQLFYRHFYNSIFKHPEYIAIPSGLDEEAIKRVYVSLKYDNPHILCLKNSYRVMKFGNSVFLCPDYSFSADKCAEQTKKLNECATELCNKTEPMTDDFSKELFLHDELVKNCEYGATDIGSSAYDALVEGKSACTGYAMAMKLLLDKVGIASSAVSGNAAESGSETLPHMWLCVSIDGNRYHLDPTWDDPVGAYSPVPVHAWFNVTEEELAKTHHDYTLPENVTCKSKEADFYIKNGLYCDGNNDAEVIERALKTAKANGTGFAEIKYADADEMRLSSKELFEDGGIHPYLRAAGYEEGTRAAYTEVPTMSVLYIYID